MFIKLTNANPQHKNNTIVINSDQIVSIHRSMITRDDKEGTKETVTFVHCPPHGTWEVEEEIDLIVSQLNQ
jgi:Icc-related predicted phosphoesterase